MNKRTKNNGITLISLVITIIVMLILVGVSITLAVNGGLFEYAGNAVVDTENAMKNEQGLVDDIINNYIKKYLPEDLKVGDYVNYTPTPGTYKVVDGGNGSGYTTDNRYQEFTTETGENALEWRVWAIDEEKGTVELISATAAQATKKLYLKGADGYNHAVDILNDMCKALYSNTNGATARSINVEDINAKTTYDYETEATNYGTQKRLSTYGTSYMKYPNLYSQEKGYGTENRLGESTGLNNGLTESGVTSYSTVTGYTDGNTEATDPYVTCTYYYYKPENLLKTDQGVNTVPTGLINLGEAYWLASRSVSTYSSSADFVLRLMVSTGVVGSERLFTAYGNSGGRGFACRPVISLDGSVDFAKSDLQPDGDFTYWELHF